MEIDMSWKISVMDPGYDYKRHIFIWRKMPNGTREIMRGDKIETIKEGDDVKPSLYLDPETLQDFANALSKQGFKPQQGFIEGKLEATEKHLQDMRDLVFEKKICKPM